MIKTDSSESNSTRPTILMVVDNEFYGDSRVDNEARLLVRNGFKVIVICFTFGKLPTFQKINEIEIQRVKINKKIKNILFGIVNTLPIYNYLWAYLLKRICKKVTINVIHAHDLYMAKPASIVAKSLKIPFVVDLHENYPEVIKVYQWANKPLNKLIAQPNKWKRLEGKYLQEATRIITLSESFSNDLHIEYKSIQKSSFWVYPNVPDVEEMLSYKVGKTILNNDNYFNITYFGGISSRRGIYTCIEALKMLIPIHKNIRLVLIGPVDGHEKKSFETAIVEESIKNNIMHIPWIDISLLPSYINDSHICLSPIVKNAQHDSGVANKVFQYMLFSKPIIVSNCTPQKQIATETNCGLVFESENAVDLKEKILVLYNDENLGISMGQNGNRAVLEKYNTKHFGDILAQKYWELIDYSNH
jgi:glycosyltransferase involved in cell wall biosynthesis